MINDNTSPKLVTLAREVARRDREMTIPMFPEEEIQISEEQFDADGLGCVRGSRWAIPLCLIFWIIVGLGMYWLMK